MTDRPEYVLFSLFSVQNITLCHIRIAGLDQDIFHTVLNVLHLDQPVLDLRLKICRYLQRQKIDDILIILFFLRVKCFFNRYTDLGQIKLCNLPVPLHYLIHMMTPVSLSFLARFFLIHCPFASYFAKTSVGSYIISPYLYIRQ